MGNDAITVSTPETNAEDLNTSDVELTQDVNTSTDELNKADIVSTEKDNTQDTAEVKTDEPKLYANKYKTVEELEKGYIEANKNLTQYNQMKSKYDDYIKRQEEIRQNELINARSLGFNSIQEKEIAQKVAIDEFNSYANFVNMVAPEYVEQVKKHLLDYYNTGNKAHLEEAKRYYSSELIEHIALKKENLKNTLQNEYLAQIQHQNDEQAQKLAEIIKNDNAEFLGDLAVNEGKKQALQMFCNAGFIQSKDDMNAFIELYNKIVNKAKEDGIKEYEAKKLIDETKKKSIIENSTGSDGTLNSLPTAEALKNTPGLYRKAVKKYGMDKIDKIILKG